MLACVLVKFKCPMVLDMMLYRLLFEHDIDFTLILIAEPNNTDMFTQSGQWRDQTQNSTFEHTLAISLVLHFATIQRLLQSLFDVLNYSELSLQLCLVSYMQAWAYDPVCGMCISFIHYQGLFNIGLETVLMPQC